MSKTALIKFYEIISSINNKHVHFYLEKFVRIIVN